MSKLVVLNNIERDISPNSSETIALTKSYVAQSYALTFTINHTNTAVIPADVTALGFFERVIKTIRLDAGASRDIINLTGGEALARMLYDNGALIYSFDKTTGASVSTFTVIVNIYNRQGIQPKDTAMNTLAYEHLNFIIKSADLSSITDVALDGISVKIREQQKSGVKPLTVNGAVVPLQNRKPLVVRKAYSADDNNLAITLPTRAVIHSAIFFVVDGDDIVEGAIDSISTKILQNFRQSDDFETLHNLNSLEYLKNNNDTDFNGLAIVDYAQGETTQAIDTRKAEENYGEIVLSVKKSTFTNPVVIAIFNTVERA